MAPVAAILGSVFGTVSAFFGWLLFGLSLWNAIAVYFIIALAFTVILIAYGLLQPKPAPRSEPKGLQRA